MMTCPRCSKGIRDEANVCPHCGYTIRDYVPGEEVRQIDSTATVAVAADDDQSADLGPVEQSQRTMAGGFPLDPDGDTAFSSAAKSNAAQSGLVAKLILDDAPTDEERPWEYLLGEGIVTIGRSLVCGIALADDPLVSRLHASVRWDGTCYGVSDLGSTNGTRVNDVRIVDIVPLAQGDRIAVGRHVLIFTFASPDDAASRSEPIVQYAATDHEFSDISREEAVAATPRTWPPSPTIPLFRPLSTPDLMYGTSNIDSHAESNDYSVPTEGPQWSESAPASLDELDTATSPDEGRAGLGAAEVEHLSARLAETSNLLVRLTEGVTERSKQRQRSSESLLSYLEGVLATVHPWEEVTGSNDQKSSPLKTLLQVAQRAADDPSHLQAVVPLALHAQSLVDALRALELAITALESVRSDVTNLRRLDQD